MSQYTSQENINISISDTDIEIKDILGIHETKNEIFRDKNCIPKRSSKKLLIPFLIASSIIILFLTIVIIIITNLNRIHTMEKKLEKFSDTEKNKQKFGQFPEQGILKNNENFETNEKTNCSFSQKYVFKGNNSLEKNVSFSNESLTDINNSEKINEKSENYFSQGATLRGTNTTEKFFENPTSYYSQEKIIHDNDNSTKPNDHLPQKIIVHDGENIYFFYPNTKEYKLLYKAGNTISTFTAYNQGIIFTIETNISQIYYLPNESLNATDKNLNIIFDEPKVKPYAMEIDFISENLYIIDKEMGTLIIVNIKTKNYNLLLTDLKSPCRIALDCMEGLIFIVQTADSILRSNMDGKQPMKIIENSGITAITINEKEKRIYWVSDVSNIESSTYDGKNRKLFLIDFFHIISLTIIENQLFWLCPASDLANATLLFSRTDNGNSISIANLETINILRDPKSIKFIPYESQNFSNSFHHRCQHVGMQTPGHGYNCTCNIGWQLHSDYHSCRPVIDFMLYNKANFIRGCLLDINKASALDIIWPTLYHVESLNKKNGIHFSYDLKNDDFYFSDDRNLYKMKLKARFSNQIILLSVYIKDFVIEDVVFDWFTGNLYYIKRSLGPNLPHTLTVFNTNLGIKFQKTLKYFRFNYFSPFSGCPYAVTINPYQNSLFFNKFDNYDTRNLRGELRSIEKNNMRGMDISSTIIRDDINVFTGNHINTFGLVITIDYTNDKIYRISKSDLDTRIAYTTFDGLNEKSFVIESMNYVKSIYIHQQWLYLSNDTSIWRVHKETGKDIVKIIPKFEDDIYQKITTMKIISPSIQFARNKNNLCAINNGDCEEFCFNDPKMICGCREGHCIQNDYRHCN